MSPWPLAVWAIGRWRPATGLQVGDQVIGHADGSTVGRCHHVTQRRRHELAGANVDVPRIRHESSQGRRHGRVHRHTPTLRHPSGVGCG